MSEVMKKEEVISQEKTNDGMEAEERLGNEMNVEEISFDSLDSLEGIVDETPKYSEKLIKVPTKDRIAELFEAKHYYSEDDLLWETFVSISKIIKGKNFGQDIQAICLEGPPGSGKSLYAKTYAKILGEVLEERVDFIDYQCDSTTGKSELYEEISMPAAVTGNGKDIIISGKIVEAIRDVNAGRKVVLFIDEYDKAKEETDAFLLGFLQDGKINTTQIGVLQVDKDKSKNLQVIICKNSMREELSEALESRLTIIRLDNTTPENAKRVLNDDQPNVSSELKDLVSLYYELMYNNKEDFKRIPSCRELIRAVEEADELLQGGAPQEQIHRKIITTMLKNVNDFETFEAILKKKIDKVKKSEPDQKERLTRIFSSLFGGEDAKKMLQLAKEKADLKAQLDKALSDFASLQDKFRDVQDKNKELQGENSKLGNENEILKAEVQRMKDQKITQLTVPMYIQGNGTSSNSDERMNVTESLQLMASSQNPSLTGNWYRLGHIESDIDINLNEFAKGIVSFGTLNDGVIVYQDNSFTMYVEKVKGQGLGNYNYNFLSSKPVATLEMVETMSETFNAFTENGMDKYNSDLKVNCLVAKGFDTDCKEELTGTFHLESKSQDELYRNPEFKTYDYIYNFFKNSEGANIFVSTSESDLRAKESKTLFGGIEEDGYGNKKYSLYNDDDKVVMKDFRRLTDDEKRVLQLVFRGENLYYYSGYMTYYPITEWEKNSLVGKGRVNIQRGNIDASHKVIVEIRGERFQLDCYNLFDRFKKIKKDNYSRALSACSEIDEKAKTKSHEKTVDVGLLANSSPEIGRELM